MLPSPRLTIARALVIAMRAASKLGAPSFVGETLGHRVVSILRAPAERHAVNSWLYDARPSYLPGSPYFDEGLAPWEDAALSAPPFPSTGRYLVLGAGGGREVAPLRARGLDVWCGEPSPTLFAGLLTVAAPGRAHRQSFADLDDPDSPLVAAAPYDAIVLGSGALSHVTTRDEQHALFAALSRLGPRAPILSSQLSTHGDPAARNGTQFTIDHGFHYLFTDEELDNLAQAHGYRVRREPGWPPESTLWLRT